MQSLDGNDSSSLWPRKLKDLCMEKLGSDIQEYGKPHSPYEDAMAALELYKSVYEEWEKIMHFKVAKTNEIRAEEKNSREKLAAKQQKQRQQQHDWIYQQQYAYMHLQQQQLMWQQQQHLQHGFLVESTGGSYHRNGDRGTILVDQRRL